MRYCLKSNISIDDLYIASTLSYGMIRRLKEGKFKCQILEQIGKYKYCAYNYKGKTYGFRINSVVFSRFFKPTVNENWE